jgi:hypothetical protein
MIRVINFKEMLYEALLILFITLSIKFALGLTWSGWLIGLGLFLIAYDILDHIIFKRELVKVYIGNYRIHHSTIGLILIILGLLTG